MWTRADRRPDARWHFWSGRQNPASGRKDGKSRVVFIGRQFRGSDAPEACESTKADEGPQPVSGRNGRNARCRAEKDRTAHEAASPLAREGGGTESNVLVLLHRIVHHRQVRPHDFDYILRSTFRAVDDLTLLCIHGLPLKALIQEGPSPQVCIAICETVWPNAWRAHTDEVERRAGPGA